MQINIRKFYTTFVLLVVMFGFSAPAFATDTLNLPRESITGKFEAVTGGLVIINEKGTKRSYIKSQSQSGKYTDYITYRKFPFLKDAESMPCEVLFVDTFTVKFKTPNSGITEIQRYKITDLEINIK